MGARAAPRARAGAGRRARVRVCGTVQGVGFRPYVHRLAGELGLGGFVLNDADGVLIEVEGPDDAVARFLARLSAEAPPLAAVESVAREDLAPRGEQGFAIRPSPVGGEPRAPVTPDSATCDECLAELFDPADRRYRYPFTNCTNCGPRFTIVRGVPYDRPLTTMAAFAMCARCRAEYEDPGDRRFHAQPNACPVCGPRARLIGADAPAGTDAPAGADAPTGTDAPAGADAVAGAAVVLAGGAIVAVKGLGGYHLACRADDEAAVARLRARKHREDKPFALMTGDLDTAVALVELDDAARALLSSRARPIVLAPRRAGAPVAAATAPGAPELGVMLAYSPLHHLLCHDVGAPLVMTSGNVSDEPIAYRDDDARERLAGIADAFLVHDRPIHMRTDDSVVRTVRCRPLTLRRSRGHVPAPIPLPAAAPRPLVACGAELKSTFCVAKEARAWVGHHIGDLSNWETLRSFREGIAHFEGLFAVAPAVVVHDLHPEYLSTKYALERAGVDHVGVQHHHAHLAACLAEHGRTGPAVGAIFDGTGFGPDATVWGGELLVGDLAGFERVDHLAPVALPGGERAVRQPWRMACVWLAAALGEDEPGPLPGVDPVAWAAVARMARTGFAAPPTTSAGRLFDAVAALCGLRHEVTYEGQAAIELEAACDPAERGAYELDGLDPRPAVRALVADLAAGTGVGRVAARFHNGLARATAAACARAAGRHDLGAVVLSGGVFQNRVLLERTAALIADAGLEVLVPERLPPNDGGIAYGQAAVAASRGA